MRKSPPPPQYIQHFTSLTGWEQPHWFALPGDESGFKPNFRRSNWFDPVRRECEMVMNRAGIIDLTPFGKFEISGPDASTFLDHLCANVVPKVKELLLNLKDEQFISNK